jgi:hypothetical protein
MANSRKKTDTLAMATKGLALLMDDSNQCQLEHGNVSERDSETQERDRVQSTIASFVWLLVVRLSIGTSQQRYRE